MNKPTESALVGVDPSIIISPVSNIDINLANHAVYKMYTMVKVESEYIQEAMGNFFVKQEDYSLVNLAAGSISAIWSLCLRGERYMIKKKCCR